MTDDVWQKIREHQNRIEELRRVDVKHEGRIDAVERRVDAVMSDTGALWSESKQMHRETSRQLGKLNTTIGELVGTNKTLMWGIPLVVTIICASAGVIVKLVL